MSENVVNALKAFKDFSNEKNPQTRELQAVCIINNVLNDLEGYGAYHVLSSVLASFTVVQTAPWKSLSALIQGCLLGWDNIAQQEAEAAQEEAQTAVKH